MTIQEAKSTYRTADEMSDEYKEAYEVLFNYYLDLGEMPYGVAKARTGDPYQWITNELEKEEI